MKPGRRLLLFLLALSLSGTAAAIDLPDGFEAVPLPGVFDVPLGLTFAPDGTIFILEKAGRVQVHDGTMLQSQPFLDLMDEVNNNGDRGLLGIALHPGFLPDGGPSSWVYLLYTVSPIPGTDLAYNEDNRYSFSRLTRYRAVTAGSDVVADLTSRHILLGNQFPNGRVPDGITSCHDSHATGSLRFADDGSLMVSNGDGGHYDFQDNGGADAACFESFVHPVTGRRGPMPDYEDSGAFRSQDLRSLAGKLLRLDPETGQGYASNPFFDGDPSSNRSRIWAYGLRNPFRFDLRPGTGAADPALGQPNVAYLGDVGWSTWEDSHISRGGENFGWPCFEGQPSHAGYQSFDRGNDPLGRPDCADLGPSPHTVPALAWHHSSDAQLFPPGLHVDDAGNPLSGFHGNTSIGGTFFLGGSYPIEYEGRYIFGDFGQSWIRTMEVDAGDNVIAVRDFAFDAEGPVDFQRHPVTGDIWFVAINTGCIYQIRFADNRTPVAVAAAAPTSGDAPLLVQFDGTGSSDPDGDLIRLRWEFGDGGFAQGPQPVHEYVADGLYTAELTVRDPGGLFSTDPVQIAVGNQPPTADIIQPRPGQLFTAPASIDLRGRGRDGDTPPAGLTYGWVVDLIHNTHTHPAVFVSDQQNAVLAIDSHGLPGDLNYYRVELTVTDGGGLSATEHLYIYPAANRRDISAGANPIALVDELLPPGPQGGGNPDKDVMRDGDRPPVGNEDSQRQYDTFHFGDQAGDDWLGYELTQAPGEEARFVSVLLQEGMHFVDGGWFLDLQVEARQDGSWVPAENLTIFPDYPFEVPNQPFFDGLSFQTYNLFFDPIAGDALRVRGTPGGSASFLSCGELRVFQVSAQ